MILIQKVELAKQKIIEAYKKHNGNIFISFSGGKDSTILLHIARSIYPDIKVVFSNTTNELFEVFQYVKTFDNIIHVKPKLSFSEVIRKHGFPAISKEVSQKVYELKTTNGATTRNTRMHGDKKGNGRLSTKWRFLAELDFNVTNKCCAILKKDPLNKWAKEHNMTPVIALMADESMLRQQLALYGEDEEKKIYPFLRTGWTEQDIWDYAMIHNIRFAECYYDRVVDGHFIPARTRTGCEYCAFGVHLEENDRFYTSAILTPKRYNKMMKLSNNGTTFREVIDLIKSKNLPKPILDIYGGKLSTSFEGITHKYSVYNLISNQTRRIACSCGSKNHNKTYKVKINFCDTPNPVNGKVRDVFVEVQTYHCNDCGNDFYPELHMFNLDFQITNRLLEYIEKNINKKSMSDILEETNLSFERLLNILQYLKEKTNNFAEYRC